MARILIIDDDDAVRKMLRRMLEHVGHCVIEAADGEAGLQMLAQGKRSAASHQLSSFQLLCRLSQTEWKHKGPRLMCLGPSGSPDVLLSKRCGPCRA